MKKNLLILIALLFGFQIVLAQTNVTGTVNDASTGHPIPGVTVRVKGSTTGASTNTGGVFSISAPSSGELVFSYTGYKTLTVAINGRTSINVTLTNDINQLNEVVLIGTRSAGRVKLETAVPIDVVNVSKAATTTGRLDLTDILNYAAPSFNYNKQSALTVPTMWNWVPCAGLARTKRWYW
jgi:iron complex outermembrane receptor protein